MSTPSGGRLRHAAEISSGAAPDGAGSRVPTVDGMEAVALQLNAADATAPRLDSNTAPQPARQAALRPQEVEEQCSPTACIARRQGPI